MSAASNSNQHEMLYKNKTD